MEEILIANLTLDTYRKNNVPPLIVPQGDYGARVIRVNVTDQGKPVFVESTAAASIVATRSGDGESLAFSGKVNDDGSVTVPVTQWMLDMPDEDVICHVVVTGNGYQYSTTSFLIEPQEKANPNEITPDDPRVDVVTEVLANENARKAAEAERQTNENTRKTAENSRQSAETQRLTDEATRVANEQQRVSAEASRDATFKSWANDIALLPDMSARISRNSKRLDGLEQRIKPSPFVFDETVAYQKDVPSNAVGAAEIHKIGGMTYKDGDTLKSAKVTEVKSVGVNLLPLTYETSGTGTRGEKIIVNPDLSIEVSGKPTASSYNTIASLTLKAGTYSLRDYGTSSQDVRLYVTYGESTTLFAPTTFTLNEETSIRIRLAVYDTFNGNTVTIKPVLVRGSVVPQSYTQSVRRTLPIPEAVRPANGINDEVYDSIEWSKDGRVKTKRVKCGVVDLGSFGWSLQYDAGFGISYFQSNRPLTRPNGGGINTMLCGLYDVVNSRDELRDKTISPYNAVNNNSICVMDSAYTDAATFKAAMSGVMLVYELATPEVTDISDLITSDNLIGVEGNGTLTFENEYGYAVPFTVEYITAESE